MKKLIFSVSICVLCSGIAMAQQQDSTFLKNGKSTDKTIEQNNGGKYSDSSSKYAPYGDNKKNKHSKTKNKRDKVDSVNPKSKM